MVISPSGLPNTGLSGSRKTAASLGSPSADVGFGTAAIAAPPSRVITPRRLGFSPVKSSNLRIRRPVSLSMDLRREIGNVTRQHIQCHRDNDSRKHAIEGAAP